jgi:iron complex outermembrane recepter protein
MRFKTLAQSLALSTCLVSPVLVAPAFAQTAAETVPAAQAAPKRTVETVVVTGSSIKRAVNNSALPIQIITRDDIDREGISSPEQLMMLLTSAGNGPDNLASNADVVAGAQRGNNGASSANLRGQGSAGTLVLFNGRRVAAHGLNGGSVDINQIPFAAIERVDVLKDGASAIYGTDAIGGVINYITRKDFQGFNAQTAVDITEAGGSEIFRASLLGGYGDLGTQGFNIMASLSWSDNKALEGEDRDWVNGFQPNRGLSIDTRGTPFATVFPLNASVATGANPNGSLLGGTGTTLTSGINQRAPFLPGSTTVFANGGVNTLDLPGGAGCNSVDGMEAYDAALWNNPSAAFACAWDTGRAVVLQQPITKYNFVSRAVARFGDHEIAFEALLSNSVSAKRFSNPQFSSGALTSATTTSHSNFLYPLNDATRATYNQVYTSLLSVFPTLGAPVGAVQPAGSRYGLPIAYRWRCIECGQREIETTTDTARYAITADGPLAADWEYRTGLSFAKSESSSLLGSGYYYRNSSALLPEGKIGIVNALNRGNINVFLPPGQTQTAAALADLEAASARGVTLYGGEFTVSQFDGSISGPLFELPGGKMYAAVGFDLREENYSFNGDTRTAQAEIFLAPFDNANALTGKTRNISAIYGELMLPLIKGMELTLAARRDAYTGFGTTTNPKVSIKYRPIDPLLFRGSYNTGFRVPSFNQIFNGVQLIAFPGATLADPLTCPGGLPDVTKPGCAVINPDIANGGRSDLGPEKAEQWSFGFVWEPSANFSASLDWWSIARSDTIILPSVTQLRDNFAYFPEAFIRDASGRVVVIDARWSNAGESETEGVELSLRGRGNIWGGQWSSGVDGTYLLKKRSRLLPLAPWSASEVGVFTFNGDLGLQWKHNAFVTYRHGDWSASLSQIYRDSYTNGKLPGVANGSVKPPEVVEEVESYITYNTSVSYRGFKNFTITAGIKNLLDQDPPFAITYDSNGGSGGNWEPRVADPRGRSFTLLLDYKF